MKPAPTSGLPVSIFVGMTDVGDGNADDVLLAAAAADDLDGVGLEDGHFLRVCLKSGHIIPIHRSGG